MDDHIRRLLAQQEAFERAADPVAQFRKFLGPASATNFAQLALETELETRAKLLRDASGSLNSLASAHAGYDDNAGIRASLGLGSLRDSVPESVRASMLGELNAARLKMLPGLVKCTGNRRPSFRRVRRGARTRSSFSRGQRCRTCSPTQRGRFRANLIESALLA
jgi:hypothetical protein